MNKGESDKMGFGEIGETDESRLGEINRHDAANAVHSSTVTSSFLPTIEPMIIKSI